MLAQLLIRAAATASATASAGFKFEPTITSDTTNYNLRSAAVSAGWNQTDPLIATVTINSGVVVSSDSTTTPAFDTGSGFPAGTQLTLINNGYVCGMGGAGGSYGAGKPGGAALAAQFSLNVTNNQILAGGGGGGGSGQLRGGGGGRTGRFNSEGGYSANWPGDPGTFNSGGVPGYGGSPATTGPGYDSLYGGGGGGWGAHGGSGEANYWGGAGGSSVTGNSYITWLATGTRYGAVT